MEEIAEGIVRTIGGAIRWFLWEIIFHIVLFNVGRVALLIVTFGRYPRGQSLEKDVNKIIWAGVIVVFLVWASIAIFNNYG